MCDVGVDDVDVDVDDVTMSCIVADGVGVFVDVSVGGVGVVDGSVGVMVVYES